MFFETSKAKNNIKLTEDYTNQLHTQAIFSQVPLACHDVFFSELVSMTKELPAPPGGLGVFLVEKAVFQQAP